MNDLISRQQAVDAIRAMQTYKLFAGDDLILVDKAGVMTELMMLPSAQPELIAQDAYVRGFEQGRTQRKVDAKLQQERKAGTWFIHKWGDDAQCSNCGRSFKDVYDMDNYDQYCRHCGTHMKGIRAI